MAVISAFLWAGSGEVQATPVYGSVFYYYHNDNLGSSNVLTDRSGAMVQHYEYGTYGKTTYQNNTTALPISNLYTGQIFDDQTGLYYYNARYYDPHLGRFIQPDSIIPSADDPQTLNRYSYVENNPVNKTDPSGHSSIFNALWDNTCATFSSDQSIISFCLDPGATIAHWQVDPTLTYLSNLTAGPELTYYTHSATTLAVGVAQIIVGAYYSQWGMVVSGALSVAATAASMAGDQNLATNIGWASIGVEIAGMACSYGQYIPLIGGMLEAAGEIIVGLEDIVLATATFGEAGGYAAAFRIMNQGIVGLGKILFNDIEAGFWGIVGTGYVWGYDIAQIATFGGIKMPGRNSFNALDLAGDIIIPHLAKAGGKSWGSTQGMTLDQAKIWIDKKLNLPHDDHFPEKGSYASLKWVGHGWSPIGPGEIGPGPLQISYVLIGTLPFAIVGAFGY